MWFVSHVTCRITKASEVQGERLRVLALASEQVRAGDLGRECAEPSPLELC